VHIPAELAAIVTAVFGLDNRNRRRHQRHRRPVGEYISRRAYPRPNVQLPQHRRGKPNNSFACPPVGADQTCIQPRGRLHPGFRRLGYPPRRRICLQCQLGNLHWRDLHPLDHQFSFTALSRRSPVGRL
jgi:hypothetical protein